MPSSAPRPATLFRSLEALRPSAEHEAARHRELPPDAAVFPDGVDRRRFLGLAAGSVGLAGLAACTKQPPEKIVPYVRQPEHVVPGRPLFFATTLTAGGYGVGLLAESHLGRPTKVEGNPDHPASLGATSAIAQASVLDLYDPDRSTAVLHLGRVATWNDLVAALAADVGALAAKGGEGVRILSGAVTSPTFGRLMAAVREKLPGARWHRHEPAGLDAAHAATREAYGEALGVRYDLTKADVVVAVDADFLTSGPGAVRYARDYASRRRIGDPATADPSRLYSVESVPTSLSTVADHRLTLKPTEVAHFVLALAARLGVPGATVPASFADGERGRWLDAVAEDLGTHTGRSLVVAGEAADPEVHVLVHGINARLGNLGATVLLTEPVELGVDGSTGTLAELVADMEAGAVQVLLVLGSNPVYSAPADLRFALAYGKVALRIHLGSHLDETAAVSHWHVPESHSLETWSDARAFDGTASIGQPLVLPLYESKSALALLAALAGDPLATDEKLVRETWASRDDRAWRRVVHDGVVAGSEAAVKTMTPADAATAAAAAAVAGWTAGELELAFRPDPHVGDGRHANNGWLQELPKPITKLTWDNALLLSPRTARERGFPDVFAYGDQRGKANPFAAITVGERTLQAAVWVVPGLPDGVGVLHLGYGRKAGGRNTVGAGFDAYAVRPWASPWRATAKVEPAAGEYLFASTQDHHSMEGRDLVRSASLEAFRHDPHHFEHGHHGPDSSISLMPGWSYDSYRWGLSIDLTTCTGCNACVAACNAENNIPVVGKDQVSRGREMHWIRIDRYFAGSDDAVDAIFNQPVTCMQCEQAPCEVVCPVAATVHSDEGLNDMVYNRCVGTRYCSNNCPYKVRRFNFLLYQDFDTPSLQLLRNPDVTIRSRGVMEKCTYCVQRINHARITAKKENRRIRDGEVVTACQQACPSQAIVFGDLADPASKVSQAKASPLDYNLLDELGTRPRTTYLARLTHPNPALAPADAGNGTGHGEAAHG